MGLWENPDYRCCGGFSISLLNFLISDINRLVENFVIEEMYMKPTVYREVSVSHKIKTDNFR